MNKELEWNENEPMNSEYALSVIESVKKFIRGRFYMPDRQAFNGEADFEAWKKEIDGLEDYIKRTQRKADEQGMANKKILKVNKAAETIILFLKKSEFTIREALAVLEDVENIIAKEHLDLKL